MNQLHFSEINTKLPSLQTNFPINSLGIFDCDIANLELSSNITVTDFPLKFSKFFIVPSFSIGGNGLFALHMANNNNTKIVPNSHNQSLSNFIVSTSFYKPINGLDNCNLTVSGKEIQLFSHNIDTLFSYSYKGRVVYKGLGGKEYE